jgi:hypothetical protein
MENSIPSKRNLKASRSIAILRSDKAAFNSKLEEIKSVHILIKGTIHQETMIVNINALNIDVPNFIKQTLLNIKGQVTSTSYSH